MRTTVDLTDEAYQIAKTVARERNQSLGAVVSDFITGANEERESGITILPNGVPTFRCKRRITSEDVKALEDDE